jgi:hypothetical protein
MCPMWILQLSAHSRLQIIRISAPDSLRILAEIGSDSDLDYYKKIDCFSDDNRGLFDICQFLFKSSTHCICFFLIRCGKMIATISKTKKTHGFFSSLISLNSWFSDSIRMQTAHTWVVDKNLNIEKTRRRSKNSSKREKNVLTKKKIS